MAKVVTKSSTNLGLVADATAAGQVLTSTAIGTTGWSQAPGSAVMLGAISRSVTLTTGYYFGPCGITEGAFNSTTAIPWIAPSAGVLKNFRFIAINQSAGSTFYFAQSSNNGSSYSYASPAMTISAGNKVGQDLTNTVTVAGGDLIQCNILGQSYSNPGLIIFAQFEPSAA